MKKRNQTNGKHANPRSINISERFWASGVQLGMLVAMNDAERKKLVQTIVAEQFIGNYNTPQEQSIFLKQIEKIRQEKLKLKAKK